MSTKQTIRYKIRQDGIVEEIVEGVQGAQCEELTRNVENKLGDVTRRLNKPEYYQTQVDQSNVTLQHNQNQAQGS